MVGSFASSIVSLFTNLPYILAGLLGFGILIGVHEFGHFIFAKMANIHTPSFSIGMGPALVQKKIGDTVFKISAIPFGGYVEIAGMAEVGQGEQKEAHRTDNRSFSSKPYYIKVLVLFGGILFNLLFAYLAFMLLILLGVPKSPFMQMFDGTTIIEKVEANSPAERVGLIKGDKIVRLGDAYVENDFMRLLTALRDNSSKKDVPLVFMRDCKEQTATVQFDTDPKSPFRGRLGIQPQQKEFTESSFFDKITQGIKLTNRIITATAQAFISIFKRRSVEGLGGPLSILTIISQSAAAGFKSWLLLLIIISVNLALFNLLPLPVFDGGQIIFITIEAIIGRQMPESYRIAIHYASWALVILLMLWLTFKDIKVLANITQ